MKFISIFTKTPQHKRFNYTPMYYNPKEEERKEREERIKKELNPDVQPEEKHKSRIAGSFQEARKKYKRNTTSPNVALMRTLILLLIVLLLIGYLQFGSVVAYGLVVLVPLWFFIKLKGLKKRS